MSAKIIPTEIVTFEFNTCDKFNLNQVQDFLKEQAIFMKFERCVQEIITFYKGAANEPNYRDTCVLEVTLLTEHKHLINTLKAIMPKPCTVIILNSYDNKQIQYLR